MGQMMELDTTGASPAMDYPAHTATYLGFLRAVQVAIVLLVALLVGMYVFLV